MKSEISQEYQTELTALPYVVNHFSSEGRVYGNQDRNTLKIVELGKETLNVKAFKKPNFINKVAYRYFRKSKAQRSFEYAHRLLRLGIRTPKPVAYFQESTGLLFGASYYISHQLDYDLTYRELVTDPNFPQRSKILKAFTEFTFELHELGVEFLDHSPGNTLIVVNEQNDYDFYLVDLNRMKFHQTLDYETRIKNFSRLTPDKYMVLEMSKVYARLIGRDFETVFNDMWGMTQAFQEKFHRKRRMKNKLKFWKK